MSASSAASSSLTRARTPIIILSALAAISGIYYLYTIHTEEADAVQSSNRLHRSNAIHRRRRQNPANDDDTSLFLADSSGDNDEDAHIVARSLVGGDTVVDDQDDWSSWTAPRPTYQRSGQNIVQLLFRVSEDATRRNSYVHRGCACNSCNMVPIRGIRYRCANCVDFDLCEGCESQGFHNKTHIFYKIKVPAPSFGPRNVQPVWYTGDPDTTGKTLPKALIAKLSRETGFERPELDAYWEQWTFMANTDWREDPDEIYLAMDRKTFERCLVPSGGYRHAAPSLIFDRMFAFYDTNKDDLISFPEFLHGLAYRRKKDKWRKIFEGYDIDEDGYVDRKDFLRMFRSYYVLYRQMHRDMLEGLDEQQMSSTDAHRLVNSRQPLSSAFGQDGRYPGAPIPRAGEGKTVRANGELEISDGKGIIDESSGDTENREDFFRTEVLWSSSHSRHSQGYWNVMMDPPVSVEQIPDLLDDIGRLERRPSVRHNEHPNAHPVLQISWEDQGEDSSSHSSDLDVENDENWPPTFVTVTDEDAEAVAGPGMTVADLQGESRAQATARARQRERVQREIHDRWKRRQFYTDEEEGATAPGDWNDEDDVLAQVGTKGESSKNQSRPSVHSRSSSKVRFAEELDDFDTRSNPSTSSRSVPERWGGMDIPDAEKDAGKEVLFQVTQQAFNELLDPLFKAGEDAAIEAAETKKDRDKYEHIYNTEWFHTWATGREGGYQEKEERKISKAETANISQNPLWPDFPEVEVEHVSMEKLNDNLNALDMTEVARQVRQRSLSELLNATGYTVDTDALIAADNAGTEHESTQITSSESPGEPRDETLSLQDTTTAALERPISPTELLATKAHDDGDNISPTLVSQATSQVTSSPYHDPTLPQFRPDKITSVENIENEGQVSDTHTLLESGTSSGSPEKSRAAGSISIQEVQQEPFKLDDATNVFDEETQDQIPIEYLLKLWRAGSVERADIVRGGRGRLNFQEWENKVKTLIKEGKGNQMDYLGSWIEFCIP